MHTHTSENLKIRKSTRELAHTQAVQVEVASSFYSGLQIYPRVPVKVGYAVLMALSNCVAAVCAYLVWHLPIDVADPVPCVCHCMSLFLLYFPLVSRWFHDPADAAR
jgi:multidrug transporter EmrE-like cation transporter